MSRRLARKLNGELRGPQPGYVHLIAATYTALVRDLDARDASLLAKELIVQPVVRIRPSRSLTTAGFPIDDALELAEAAIT